MPNLTIEMTDAELFALDLIAVDKQDWADNVLTDRARVAKEELKSDPSWMQATVALANDGGDIADDWAVLLKGRDLGLFKTAKQRANEALAAQQINQPTPTTEADSQKVAVLSHALVLKIAAVNAMRPNEPPYPATQEVLTEVRERYRDIATSLTAKTAMGDTLSEVEKATLANIQTGFSYFEAVNQTADAIIAAGDPADPIASDARWPSLG